MLSMPTVLRPPEISLAPFWGQNIFYHQIWQYIHQNMHIEIGKPGKKTILENLHCRRSYRQKKLPKKALSCQTTHFWQFYGHKSGYIKDFLKLFFFLAYIFQYASFDVYIAIFGDKKIFGLRRWQVKLQVAEGTIKR